MTRFAVLSTLLVGCSLGSPVDLGVAGHKRLADLNGPQTCRVYEGVRDFSEDAYELSCYAYGQGLGALAAPDGDAFTSACEAAHDECMGFWPDLGDIDCALVENAVPATCDVRVKDVEDCLADSLRRLRVYDRARCDRPVDADDLAELAEAGDELPASCQAVQEACPGFMG